MSLLLVTPDGSDTEMVAAGEACLHSGHAPQWSPDGTRLAVRLAQPCKPDVFDFHADATGIIDVSSPEGGVTVIPDAAATPGSIGELGGWSPDGSRLLVHTSAGSGVLDLADLSFRRIAVPRRLSLSGDAWSPDGTRIALNVSGDQVCESPLYVADAGTGAVQPVASTAGLGIPSVTWSPDGRVLAFVTDACGSDGRLGLYDLAEGKGTLVGLADGWSVSPGPPGWSPVGDRVAFEAYCGACDDLASELRIIDDTDACLASLADCSWRTIVRSSIGGYSWSPAGDRIAYLRFVEQPDQPDAVEIWSIGADGAGAVRIFGPASNATSDPAWQPGG